MPYLLSTKSRRKLDGLHPDLIKVVQQAIQISTQDFCVTDGLRSAEQQRWLVQQGKSRTQQSRHLEGKAVDLVPWIDGKPQWHWPAIYPIAQAMRSAARQLQVALRWGGAWDIDFTSSVQSPESLSQDYLARRRKAQQPAFMDGVHFELARKTYP